MTDSLALHMLSSVRHALATEIAPAVQSGDAKLSLDMVARLLQWLAVRLEHGAQVEAEHDEVLARLLGTDGNVARGFDWSDTALVDGLIEAERRYVVGLDPEGKCSIADNYAAGRAADEAAVEMPPAVTDERLTAYLRNRFPQSPEIAAVDTVPLTGGFGKDTILFTIRGGGDRDGPVVMRKDLPISPIDAFAADEFPLLRALDATGIPVPAPLWVEEDRSWFGGGFIVVRRMPGTIDTESWTGDPDKVLLFAEALARIMARIHALTPTDLPLDAPPPATASEGTRTAVLSLRDLFRRKVDRPNSRLEAAFAWLLDNIPDCGGAPARLVHGDIGFHNLLIDRGDVSAVLDWEFAHFGDPAEDVAYVRPFIERVMPWDRFLAIYRDHGGLPYGEAQDRFFAVWRNARNAASCTGSAYAFRQAPAGSIKLATGGLIYGPRFEMEALTQIRDSRS